MFIALKRGLLVVFLVAALLIVLIGGIIRVQAVQAPGYHSGTPAGHQLAWYCPAPPVSC